MLFHCYLICWGIKIGWGIKIELKTSTCWNHSTYPPPPSPPPAILTVRLLLTTLCYVCLRLCTVAVCLCLIHALWYTDKGCAAQSCHAYTAASLIELLSACFKKQALNEKEVQRGVAKKEWNPNILCAHFATGTVSQYCKPLSGQSSIL